MKLILSNGGLQSVELNATYHLKRIECEIVECALGTIVERPYRCTPVQVVSRCPKETEFSMFCYTAFKQDEAENILLPPYTCMSPYLHVTLHHTIMYIW